MTSTDATANARTPQAGALPILTVTGTRPAHWRDWVGRLWPDRTVTCLDAADLGPDHAGGPVLVVVASPTWSLATALAAGEDALPALGAWESAARALLRHLQSDPARFVVVDLEEAMQAPEALAGALAPLGPGGIAPGAATRAGADPVWTALAARIVGEHPVLRPLAEELAVSCVVLEGAGPRGAAETPDAVNAYRGALQARTAVQERLDEALAALERAQAAQAGLEARLQERTLALDAMTVAKQAELAAMREECVRLDRGAKDQFELARSQADRLREEFEAERARGEAVMRDFRELGDKLTVAQNLADDRRREADLNLIRLHEAQAEVSRLTALVDEGAGALAVERESLQAERTARSQLAADLAAADLQCRTLMLQSAVTQQERLRGDEAAASLRAALQRTESEVQGIRREREALLLELQASRASADLVLTQLQLQQATLAEAQAAASRAGVVARGLDLREVVVLADAQDGVHRHVDLLLRGLSTTDAPTVDLPLRLVEHHGHPGLALHRAPGEDTLLSAWRTSGTEDGREYQLLVPQDQPAREFLLGLGHSDWSKLTGLVALVRHHLAGSEDPVARGWARPAARLLLLLDALPGRLRYDAIRSETPSGADTTIELLSSSFGARELGDVSLVAAAGGERLEWRLPDAGGIVPCLAWPVSAQGTLAPVWRLPVGSALEADAKRQAWADMSADDRDLVLGVLDALCGDASLAPRAVRWREEARQTLASIRKANLARRLLRRIAKP